MLENTLHLSRSPYLLQHAHNPVHWQQWNENTLNYAKIHQKPIIVSIGYSACHWCHVMEKESFESEQVAQVMNEYFVCIKIDREERPDVDAIYMEAVQMMGVQGGWPLNVFLTHEGEPFWGGTYFPKEQWIHILNQIGEAYQTQQAEIITSAKKVTKILSLSSLERYQLKEVNQFDKTTLEQSYQLLEKKFDHELGGIGSAPKFPMPSYYLFLLRYYNLTKNKKALEFVNLTLEAMAQGGIYDQIGGGFARYSVDSEWFVPHFEKMLYDNAQLLSLYAEAYVLTKKESYRETVEQTIQFLKKELLYQEKEYTAFYSALDADSEGEEGKFYVWTTEELETHIEEADIELFKKYYSVENLGNWAEANANILHRQASDEEFAKANQIDLNYLKNKVSKWHYTLASIREERIKPGLDDKILTSWNALTIKGLCDAYAAFAHEEYLELALSTANFIEYRVSDKFTLFHTYKNESAAIVGFLEDYAFVIEAYIKLYQSCFDEKWLERAGGYLRYCLDNFFDKEEELFFFTDQQKGEKLIAQKKELFDNVIPSSNSVMATNLYFLGVLLEKEDYIQLSQKMLQKMAAFLTEEPHNVSNWATLFTYFLNPTAEIAIVGKDYKAISQELNQYYIPNKVLVATEKESSLPILEMRLAINEQTTLYVCKNKMCQVPVHSVAEALEQV